MDEQLEDAAYEGLTVDLVFRAEQPSFGDLFPLVGEAHPSFPPSGRFRLEELHHLGFEQVDDYFGIRNEGDDGDDVLVWLYPVVRGEVVAHNPGPYSALRLEHSVLRHREGSWATFIRAVEGLAVQLDVEIAYVTRGSVLSVSEVAQQIESDASEIVAKWKAEGIVPGSDDALMVDF